MARDLLVIGIDGGTWTILQPAIDGGYMPFLQECVHGGSHGTLRSTLPPITPVAWSSFQTGRDPGNLGISTWSIWNRETKKSQFINSQTLGPTLWKHAGDQGLRVATVNVPVTYPPHPINGCVVPGLLTPSVDQDFTYPPELRDELLEAVPNYQPPERRIINAPTASEYSDFLKARAEDTLRRLKAGQLLIRKEAWNLFMLHFQAHDFVQHWLWPYLDRNHKHHDENIYRDIMETFYRPLDQAMGQIYKEFLERSSNDAGILLISDHGFQANKRVFNLHRWLLNNDLLAMNRKFLQRRRWTDIVKALDFLKLHKHILRKLQRGTVNKFLPSFWNTARLLDWEKTKAFALPGSQEVLIHVTAKEGTAEYSDIVDTISQQLRELVDSKSGTRVVKSVRHKSEAWQGEKMDLMPDVVAELAEGYSARLGLHPELFRDLTPGEDVPLGIHHRDGIIIATGPGFRQASDINCSITDVAPTIMAYLGLDVPDIMDGELVGELLENVEQRQEASTAAEEHDESSDSGLSSSEEAIIEQRLEDLGYM